MKILLTMNVPYFPAHGGSNKANRCLSEGLVRRGHEVKVVTPTLGTPSTFTREQLRERLRAKGVTLRSMSGIDEYLLEGVQVNAVASPSQLRAQLLDQIRQFQPHVVLVSSEDPSQNLLSAALSAGPERVVYLAHSPSFFPFGPGAFFPSPARAKLLGQAAAIIAVSNYVAQYLRQWGGLESSVIYWPAYGDGPFPKLDSFDNEFVTMVNPCAVKGLSIFEPLVRDLPDIRFAAVPTWGTTREDRATLEELPNLQLLAPSENIDDILAQTRILLVPSLWGEAFGLIVVEALLRGIPVLASDSGGIVEAKLGTNYVLPVRPVERFMEQLDSNMVPTPVVPRQDIEPWRQALRRLLSDREHFETEAVVGREAALQFVSRLSVTSFEDLFKLVAGGEQGVGQSVWAKPPAADIVQSNGNGLASPANLSPEQRALLIIRLRKRAAGKNGTDLPRPEIPRVSRKANLPLSFAQQRLWFSDQLAPGLPTYNISGSILLTGPLNLAALRQSLNEIVRRHEILRTTFQTMDSEVVQVVAPASEAPLPIVDLAELRHGKSETQKLANEAARRGFRLDEGPLLRTSLLHTGENEHVLIVTIHHIISDAWSLRLLVQELAALYRTGINGEPSDLPELSIQYGDFAHWQRDWLQGEVLEKQFTYWQQRLAEAPGTMELPTDRPRPAMQTFNGALQRFKLSRGLSRALNELRVSEGVTLFMTLLAAFQVLLHRYTGEDHSVIGTNITNRNRADIEPLIGLFTNNLVLHTDLSGDPTFRELLGVVRELALGAYAHQDFPFEKLVERLRPERDPSRSPLIQILFVLQNSPPLDLELAGLTLTLLESDCQVSKFDLTLFMEEETDGLGGAVEYNSDLFDGSTIVRLLSHFETLLENIVTDPGSALSTYSLTRFDGPLPHNPVGFNDNLEAC